MQATETKIENFLCGTSEIFIFIRLESHGQAWINLKFFLGCNINFLSIWPLMCHPWFPTRKASKLTFVCFQHLVLNAIQGLNNWSWKQTYEGDFWTLCIVTFWQKVKILERATNRDSILLATLGYFAKQYTLVMQVAGVLASISLLPKVLSWCRIFQHGLPVKESTLPELIYNCHNGNGVPAMLAS